MRSLLRRIPFELQNFLFDATSLSLRTPAFINSRDTLLSTDRSTAITLEPIGDGKIRVRTSTWDQEVVILADQALEVVAMGKSLRGAAAAGVS